MAFNVKYIADLAHLDLNQEEEELFTTSMDRIVHFVETITSLDLTACSPSVSSYDMPTVFREDILGDVLSKEEIAQNTPKVAGSDIIVPQVIKK